MTQGTRTAAFVIGALAIVATIANIYGSVRKTRSATTEPFRVIPNWRPMVGSGHPVTIAGSESKDTLVEFLDYQCPACRALWQRTEQLSHDVGAKLYIEVHYVAAADHELAIPAARAVYCAGAQDHFLQYHRTLFDTPIPDSEPSWNAVASEAGVPNLARFSACVRDSSSAAAVKADQVIAGHLGGYGTPVWSLDGAIYEGLPWDFEQIVSKQVSSR